MNHGLELSKLLAGYIALGCAALLQASPAQAGDPNDVANFRAGRSCMRCDLRYENYAGIVVHGADLRGVYMLSVNLSNARLLGAQMQSSNLEYADLSRADLSRANLSRTTLSSASLAGATLIGATLQQDLFGAGEDVLDRLA